MPRNCSSSLRTLIGILLLSLAAPLAHAGTISYTVATPNYPTAAYPSPGIPATFPNTTTLNVPKFDGSLGTLTGISFTLTALMETSILVDNPTAAPFTVSYASDTSVVIPLINPAFLSFGLWVYSPIQTATLQADPGIHSYLVANRTLTKTYSTFALDQYKGTETQDLLIILTELGPDFFGAGPRTFVPEGGAFVQTAWAAQLQTEYTYAPAPEPVSLWMIGGGLLAMAAATRLRRRWHS